MSPANRTRVVTARWPLMSAVTRRPAPRRVGPQGSLENPATEAGYAAGYSRMRSLCRHIGHLSAQNELPDDHRETCVADLTPHPVLRRVLALRADERDFGNLAAKLITNRPFCDHLGIGPAAWAPHGEADLSVSIVAVVGVLDARMAPRDGGHPGRVDG